MSDPFEKALDFVLTAEGDLVDDPPDPGGLTKFGISQRAYPMVGSDGHGWFRRLAKAHQMAIRL
jgi:lysozyme family protein